MRTALAIALGGLTAAGSILISFPAAEVHLLDFKQRISFRTPPPNPFVVRHLPQRTTEARDTFAEARSIILTEVQKLVRGDPTALILTLERTSMANSNSDPRIGEFLHELEVLPHLYLYQEHRGKYLGSEPPFDHFSRSLNFTNKTHDIPGIPPGDDHTRRLFLYYHDHPEDGDLVRFLTNLNLPPRDGRQFRGSFEFMETEQAYIKFWPRDSFTLTGEIAPGSLKGKVVLVGFDDIFNYAYSFAPTGKSYQKDKSRDLQWDATLPEHEFLANVLQNLWAGQGVRTLPSFWGHLFISIFCLVLAYLCLSIQTPRDILLVSVWVAIGNAVPFALFFVQDWYLPSLPTLLSSVILPYFSLPLALYQAMKRRTLERLEAEKKAESLRQEGRLAARSAEADAGFRLATRVAHDIRSPLSALQIIAGLIPPEDKKSDLMRRSVTRLEEIASSLLTSYKASGRFGEQQTSICSVEKLLSHLKLHGEKVFPEIEMQFSNLSGVEHFECSSVELERVLFNLLSNSVEALRQAQTANPKIEIEIQVEESNHILRFRDNGPGIPAELQPRLFGEGVTFGKTGGTGLGLASARQFLQKVGGHIALEPSTRGACFRLSLPKSSENTEIQVTGFLVIADDDPDILQVLGRQVKDSDRALITPHPLEALTKIRELMVRQEPFTVCTDLVFHGSNLIGFDLLSETGDVPWVQRVLYTTLASEPQIQAICERSGLRLIDKRVIPHLVMNPKRH